jgi:SET domain-containing protein
MSKVLKNKKEKKFQLKKTLYGLGLFANKNFKRGDFLIEYTGEKISNEEADRRGGKYLMTLNKKYTIDGKGRENVARYINHSCKPNCTQYIEGNKVKIYARRKIEIGDELHFNYGKDYCDMYCKPCLCDACLNKKKK